MCAKHGADVLGFVVEYPHPVPWNMSMKAAKELIEAVPKTVKTCVVTGGPREKMLRIAHELKPDYMQLHDNESLEDVAYLVSELGKRDIKIIKTLFPNTPDLKKTARDFAATGIYALLLDPRTPENATESGGVDYELFEMLKQAIDCPVILAGGITADNIAKITASASPVIIDVMTGVEKSSGVKDEAKVASLLKNLSC